MKIVYLYNLTSLGWCENSNGYWFAFLLHFYVRLLACITLTIWSIRCANEIVRTDWVTRTIVCGYAFSTSTTLRPKTLALVDFTSRILQTDWKPFAPIVGKWFANKNLGLYLFCFFKYSHLIFETYKITNRTLLVIR